MFYDVYLMAQRFLYEYSVVYDNTHIYEINNFLCTLAMGVTFVTEMNDYYIYYHKRPDIISQNMNDLKTKNA